MSGAAAPRLIAGLIFTGWLVSGCASAPVTDAPPDDTLARADALVATELSDVFANAFEPLTTTVQVSSGSSDNPTMALVDALVERGFGIQRVPADQGARFLDVSREMEPITAGRTALRWRASIGSAEIRRQYQLEADGSLSTGGPLRLSGVRTDIQPEDLERMEPMIVDPAHRRIEYEAPEAVGQVSPVISLITPAIVEGVAQSAGQSSGALNRQAPSLQGLNASRVETGNLFYDSESNFGSTLDGRDRVGRRIVVFANDSLNIGPQNRQMLAEFVAQNVSRDDVISLVGCSNGPTALAIGNEGLALGRAKRVSEELVMHGIARERIFDEGCWAPVSAGDRFPGRGVVVELWRAPA